MPHEGSHDGGGRVGRRSSRSEGVGAGVGDRGKMEEAEGRWQRPHSSESTEGPARPGSGSRTMREGRSGLDRRLGVAG